MPEDGDEEIPVSHYQDSQSLVLPCRGRSPVAKEEIHKKSYEDNMVVDFYIMTSQILLLLF